MKIPRKFESNIHKPRSQQNSGTSFTVCLSCCVCVSFSVSCDVVVVCVVDGTVVVDSFVFSSVVTVVAAVNGASLVLLLANVSKRLNFELYTNSG